MAFEQLGLDLLNLLARQGRYQLSEHNFGERTQESLDFYVVDPAAPCVVFCHGGNWRSYDKRQFRFVADALCSFGMNVILPNFLKYPDARFSEILSSAVRGVDFALRELVPGADILMMGHSSGAQLAALMTLNGSLLEQPDRVRAMVGISGPYDFYPFTEDDHWDLFGPEAHYPLSQPINFVRADAPELYLLHGAEDTRVKRGHSKSLMEKQQAAGGAASREVYSGMGHVDTVLSFSRIHRRNNPLVHDIQGFIETRFYRKRGNPSGTK